MNEDEVLTVKEAAAFLKVSIPTIYQLKARKEIPFRKIGGSLRFLKSELIDYIKKC